MADAFTVQVQDGGVVAALNRVLAGLDDATPLMEDLARLALNTAEDAFITETDPWGYAWHPLAAATIESRTRAGTWPGKVLQVHAILAGSLVGAAGADYAEVGTPMEYGAIHQFGGVAGRKSAPVEIPARPFLPVDERGQLPPAFAEEVVARADAYLEGLVG